ncbi:hypothetical protein M3Y99_00670700 [Aphelenchoides fujianensis]|nr:hypothetical protein M3Y99_00670700 [Aphelenchoides fujianensis]
MPQHYGASICVNVVFFACMHRKMHRRNRSQLPPVQCRPPSALIRLQERNARSTDPFDCQPQRRVNVPITTTFPPFKSVDRRPPTATCGTQTSSTAAESLQLAPPSYIQAVLSEDAAVGQQTSPPPYSSSD